jgi:tetratricopeptide (TPR) repeat protein
MWWQGKEEERIPLLERAVEVDPNFAGALLALSTAHLNLGHRKEALEYGKRALEHSERLPDSERFFMEGSYYADVSLETWGRSVEAYKKAIESGHSNHHNLARRYLLLEAYDEAIEHFEYGRKRRWPAAYSHFQLAQCYAALGEFEKGYQVLQEFLTLSPNNWAGERGRGRHLIVWGKLDEASAAFSKADSIRPRSLSIEQGRWLIHVLGDHWDEAENSARKMAGSTEPLWRWFGTFDQGINRLYSGRSQEALRLIDEAASAGYFDVFRSGDESYAAHILLETGDYQSALQRALRDRTNYGEHWAGREGLFYAALAQARMGHFEQAEKIAAELLRKAQWIPGVVGKRLHHQLLGELALIGGDATRALKELEAAHSMLAPRALLIRDDAPLPQHLPIWFSLATAHLTAGEEQAARRLFERITESSTERIWWPIPYVRSFYFLGNIYEKRGEIEKARENYDRFVDFWKDGDMDRERVQEALRKLLTMS